MTADELGAFVRNVLEGLDDEPRSALVDALIARAAKGAAGWRPPGPFRGIVAEVVRFVEAAFFPAFAGLLADGTMGKLSAELFASS